MFRVTSPNIYRITSNQLITFNGNSLNIRCRHNFIWLALNRLTYKYFCKFLISTTSITYENLIINFRT